MTDFETKLRKAVAGLPDSLEGYATRAAMLELADNWRAALGDGTKPADLVGDIDRVVTLLHGIKSALAAPAPRMSGYVSPS